MIPTLPNEWAPRPHQQNLFRNFGFSRPYQRAAIVWHRRAGKDSTALNLTACEMLGRVGTYWHLLPEQTQARKVVWNGIDKDGRRIIDQCFPKELRVKKREDEMLLEFAPVTGKGQGSMWQLAGSDNYNSLVGANPVGVVFSEWALCDPAAWNFIRPIIVENGGWAMFIYTPRGMNHGFHTYHNALTSDEWFAEKLTVDDTGLITKDQIQKERDDGMGEALIQQEFYCSFEADNDSVLIPRYLIQEAVDRDVGPWDRARVWGLDVAANEGGGDRSALAKRWGNKMLEPVLWWQAGEAMVTVGMVVREWERTPEHERPGTINVDAIGLGSPVASRLREIGLPAVSINVGIPDKGGRYDRLGDKLWGAAFDWFHSREVSMPRDDLLMTELSSRKHGPTSLGKMKMETKADMAKRGLRSCDIADAFVLTFAGGDYVSAHRATTQVMDYDGMNYDRPQRGRMAMQVME